jgi:hypothetical protein
MNNDTNPHPKYLFEDGRTFQPPATWSPEAAAAVDALDADGYPAHRTGYKETPQYIGLTMCCGASFKGMDQYIGCRACYHEAAGNDFPIDPVSPRVEHVTIVPLEGE